MIRYIKVVIFCLLFPGAAHAQITSLAVHIIDSVSHKSVPNVSYTVFNDQKAVLSGKSDTAGIVAVTLNFSAPLHITVSSIGYNTTSIEFTSATSTILIKASAIQLQEVTLKAEREIQFKPGKMIVNVTENIKAGANNVLELLQNVPTLSVNTSDGTIYLKGKPGVTVLLNGKPVTAEMLQTMKPGSIKQIQLLSSASAKYSAEYKNGVINLISSKLDIDGYEFSTDVVAGDRERLYASPTINLQTGKLSTNFDVAYDHRRLLTNESDNITYQKSATDENQTIDNHQAYKALDFIGSYEFDERHVLSLAVSYFGYTFNKTINDAFNRQYFSGIGNTNLMYLNDNQVNKSGLNASLDYDYTFHDKKDGEVVFSALLNNSTDAQNSLISIPDTGKILQSKNKPVDNEYTLQVDYVKPFGEHFNLESGVKYIRRENHSDYFSMSYGNANNTFNLLSQDGTFTYNQNIYALYSQGSVDLKQYSFGLGVRYEAYQYNYDKSISSSTGSFFPDISITRKFSKDYFISFEYSNKIRRPGAAYLTPFVDQSTLDNNTQGNTTLKNEFINDFSIGANLPFKIIPIFLNLDYDFYKNGISDYTYLVQDVTGIESLVNTYSNLTHHKDFSFSGTARLLGIKNIRSNLNFSITESSFQYNNISRNGIGYSIGESTSLQFAKGFRLSTSATYQSDFITLQGKTPGYTITSLSFTKQLVNPSLLIGIGADDVFNLGYPVRTTLEGNTYTHTTIAKTLRDTYYIKLSYYISKNSVKATHQTKISNSDLKNK